MVIKFGLIFCVQHMIKIKTLLKNFQDEPAAHQSDPSVLDLQLRALSRSTTTKELTVKKVVHGPQTIERWIRDISDLHQSKVVSPCHLEF